MPSLRSEPRRLRLAALAVSLLAVSVFACTFWIDAFVKLPLMRLPYKILFIVLLSGFLLSYLTNFATSVGKGVFYGALAGQVASFAALVGANFFIENGIDRTVRTVQRFGASEVLLIDFGVAFVLGGWLFGVLFFTAFGRVVEKEPRR